MPDSATQTDPQPMETILADMTSKLEAIRKDTERNSDVASKYSDRADSIFGVVDKISQVLTSPFRLLGSGSNSRPEIQNYIEK